MFLFSKFVVPNKFRDKRERNIENYLRFWWKRKTHCEGWEGLSILVILGSLIQKFTSKLAKDCLTKTEEPDSWDKPFKVSNLNNVLSFLEREIKDNLVEFIGLICWILKIPIELDFLGTYKKNNVGFTNKVKKRCCNSSYVFFLLSDII